MLREVQGEAAVPLKGQDPACLSAAELPEQERSQAPCVSGAYLLAVQYLLYTSSLCSLGTKHRATFTMSGQGLESNLV